MVAINGPTTINETNSFSEIGLKLRWYPSLDALAAGNKVAIKLHNFSRNIPYEVTLLREYSLSLVFQ